MGLIYARSMKSNLLSLGPGVAQSGVSPCKVGTSLQATRPRNQRPVWRHWARVGGRQRVQVSRPDTARLRMKRFRGLR